jgi:tetratricopeptide (TPR) repeat protein/predicted Ser/Thr protein kinase
VEPARLDCFDDGTATSFVEGRLSEDEAAEVEAHIDQCAGCREHLVRLIRARTGAVASPDAADRRLLTGGTVLGRYQILRVVGVGAMGVVYAAYDAQLRRDIALKFVRAQGNQDRLLREAHSLARLRHPNVVTVYDVGTEGDRVFIAMELIQGTTLTERLRQPQSIEHVVQLFVQAGRGLEAAHAAGLVHRDFKPDNVLVGDDGRVCVTDFGLARDSGSGVEPAAEPVESSPPVTVTRSGVTVGTPLYMAPEQHLGRGSDARSDQFAYCVALHEALYGSRPFEGDSLQLLAQNVIGGVVNRSGRQRRVPRRLARIVARGLAIAPADRHPSMAALVAQLGSSRSLHVAFAGAALVAATTVALGVAWSTRPVDRCEDSSSLVDEVWGPIERSAQLARFRGLRPHAAATIELSARIVDDWSAGWRLARHAACAADAPQRVARLGCLDQQLAELRAQLAVWRSADPEVVDRAVAAASALPAPEACAMRTAPPIDPAVGQRIAHVNALDRAGQHTLAKAELPALLAEVEASGNPAVLALALLASGRIEHALGEHERARTQLARAAQEAGRAADDPTMFDALITEAAVVTDLSRPLDSLGLISAAEALSIRAGFDRTEAIARTRGAALTEAGKLRDGIAELERALVAVSARAERDPHARVEVAAVLGAIAAAQTQQYEYQAAYELLVRTLTIEQGVFGTDHPEVAKTLHDLGIAEGRLGKYDDALAHLRQARAMFVAAYGERSTHVGMADLSLGNLMSQQNKLEEARVLLAQAFATLSAVLPPDHINIAIAEQGLAVVQDLLDRCDESIPHHQHVVAIFERTGRGGPGLANELLNLGSCLADVGRLVEAREAIERGIAKLDAAGVSELEHLAPWMRLADLEWREGKHAKAIALARKVYAATANVDRPDIVQLRRIVEQMLAEWRTELRK